MVKETVEPLSQAIDIVDGSSENRFDASSVLARHGVNRARTGSKIDAWLTPSGSQDVPAGRVYFMSAGDFIKIGYSVNPIDRLSAVQTGCPLEVKLLADFPGTMADEFAIMSLFASLHIRGEWFRTHPDILDYIDGRKRRKGARRKKRHRHLHGRDWIWL